MTLWTAYRLDTGQVLGVYESTHGYEARVRAALVWGIAVESVGARKEAV